MNIKDKLQIVLITYNRRKYVERTFEKFILPDKSPVKYFDIMVLDNNSADDTENYVKSLTNRYPNVKYQKNKYNIGISGNIAKAMEIADKEYLWIICDDDKYDWSNWNEVEQAVNKNEDVICVARYAIPEEKIDCTEYHLLQLTFVPAIIIKTSVYNDTNIRNSFDNIFTLFPHLFPIISLINKNKKIYILNKPIVDNGMDVINTDSSYIRGVKSDALCKRTRTMSWITGYANVCSMIQNKELKHKTMICAINFIHNGFKKFCKDIYFTYFEKGNWMQITDICLALDTIHCLKLFFFASLIYIKHKILYSYSQGDKLYINFLWIKFKFKKYKDQKHTIIQILGIKITKNSQTKKISFSLGK